MIEKTDWTIDEHGLLCGPKLGDGTVEGIRVTSDRCASIECSNIDNDKVVLLLRGVHALKGDSFLEGNIINRVILKRGQGMPPDQVRDLMFGRYSDPADIDRRIAELIESDAWFVHIQPSCGLELRSICGAFSIMC